MRVERTLERLVQHACEALGEHRGVIEYLADHGVELSRRWYGRDRDRYQQVTQSALAFVHNLLTRGEQEAAASEAALAESESGSPSRHAYASGDRGTRGVAVTKPVANRPAAERVTDDERRFSKPRRSDPLARDDEDQPHTRPREAKRRRGRSARSTGSSR